MRESIPTNFTLPSSILNLMTKDILAVMPTEKAKEEDFDTHFSDGLILKYSKGDTIINGLDEP